MPNQKMPTGLTLNQVVDTVAADIPSEALGDVLRRLPTKYHAPELNLYRPVVPAVLLALGAMDECCSDCDTRLADLVEVVAADPAPDPKMPAWTTLPDGSPLYINRLLDVVAQRLAGLYSPKPRRSSKKPAPVA